jgi:nitrogen fixation protein NifZ
MTERITGPRPVVARIVHRHGGRRALRSGYRRDFAPSEKVCSLMQVRNDGSYPHQDIGDVLVREGDVGCVHESWSFLGEIYYTVEFVERAVIVIMRGRELGSTERKVA